MACGGMVKARYCFISLITICTIACMFLMMKPKFASPTLRACVFICFAGSFLAPLLYASINFDATTTMPPEYGHLAMVGTIYFVGVIIYLSKIPERWLIGEVDYIGQSHNIWHLFVLTGLAVDISYSWQLYEKR